MAFSDARNTTPEIAVKEAPVTAGPDATGANAVKAFGALAGEVFRGKVEGDLINELEDRGQIINAINSPDGEIGEFVDASGQDTRFDFVNPSAVDPTGTIDRSSKEFQLLALAGSQGKISQQQAAIQAESILRRSITRAPGFAAKLRQLAQDTLGFNPSGATLNTLFLSGPDLNKVLPLTQSEKDREEAQALLDGQQVATFQEGLNLVTTARRNELETNIQERATQRGELNAGTVITTAGIDATQEFNLSMLQALNEIQTGGSVISAPQLIGQIRSNETRLKNKWRVALSQANGSGGIVYKNSVFSDTEAKITERANAAVAIMENESLMALLQRRRQEISDLAMIKGVELAPDIALMHAVGGDSMVDHYLNFALMSDGEPRRADLLAEQNPVFRRIRDLQLDRAESVQLLRDMASGDLLGVKIRTGRTDPAKGSAVIAADAVTAINKGDPVALNRTLHNAHAAGFQEINLSTAGNASDTFNKADQKARIGVRADFATTLEQKKIQIIDGLVGTEFRLGYDGKRFTILRRDGNAAGDPSLSATDVSAINRTRSAAGLSTGVTGSVGPEQLDQLNVLNNAILPVVQQPDWALFMDVQDRDAWIDTQIRDVNVKVVERELNPELGDEASFAATEGIQALPIETQVELNRAINSGDADTAQRILREQGIDLGTETETGANLEQLEEGGMFQDENGRILRVERDDDGVLNVVDVAGRSGSLPGREAVPAPVASTESFTPSRMIEKSADGRESFRAMNFTRPDNLADHSSPEQKANIKLIREIADQEQIDPNLALAIATVESGFRSKSVGPDTPHGVAKGLFQIIPATARGLEMDMSRIFEPEHNARGAMRLLHELIGRYGNDLDKVLATYNSNHATLKNAIAAGGEDGWINHMPKQTQEYIATIRGHLGLGRAQLDIADTQF